MPHFTIYVPLTINISNIEEALVSELKIPREETKVFVLIVKNGKMDNEKMAKLLNWSIEDTDKVVKSLIDRGMVIKINESDYESLHPRFAITNRYRRLCQEYNLPFKKNLKIDNIALLLERPYDHARTK
jgi:transcription initiation factor IIE alpha subunit